jgi:hypothetical protein
MRIELRLSGGGGSQPVRCSCWRRNRRLDRVSRWKQSPHEHLEDLVGSEELVKI